MPFGIGELDAQYAPENDWKPRLASNVVIPGYVLCYGFTVASTNAAAQAVMLFDAASLPADGALPIYFVNVPIGDAVQVRYVVPRKFLQGIVLANSSTKTSLTIGAVDCFFDVQFAPIA